MMKTRNPAESGSGQSHMNLIMINRKVTAAAIIMLAATDASALLKSAVAGMELRKITPSMLIIEMFSWSKPFHRKNCLNPSIAHIALEHNMIPAKMPVPVSNLIVHATKDETGIACIMASSPLSLPELKAAGINVRDATTQVR